MKDEYLVPINTKQPIENTIQFYNTNEGASIEVLRISKDGITANPNVPVDEAAQAILRALDGHIKQLTQRTWVGLTKKEVDDCYEAIMFDPDIDPSRMGVYLEIEAKLKEKNT